MQSSMDRMSTGGWCRAWMRSALRAAVVVAVIAAPAAALQVAPADTLGAAADSSRAVSPRGAMLRSFLLPGWGQLAAGSPTRAGVWFAIEGADVYMLTRTLRRLGDAKDRERGLVRFRSDSLNGAMAQDTALARRLADPLAFDSAVSAGEEVRNIRNLVESREQQRQDWITYTLFFTLLSGVDAYVNAQLVDFPVDISLRHTTEGAFVLSLRVPLGGPASSSGRAIREAPAPPPHRWWRS